MSEDITTAAAPAEGDTAEALSQVVAEASTAAPAAAAKAVEETTTEPDPFEDEKVETFDRKYVEKLRKEAADARVKAKEAASWRDGWDDSDAEVLSEVLQVAARDPKIGAEKMRQIADLLDGGKVEEAAAVAAEASEEAAAVLTPEDVDRKVEEKLAAKEREAKLQSEAKRIMDRVEELGYDSSSPEYFTVLHIAQHETGGDLDAAHEKMEARKQAIIDAYVADVQGRAQGHPRHAGRPATSPVELDTPNTDFKSARARLEQRIANLK